MQINVTTTIARTLAKLDLIKRQQVPYAAMRAINATALAIQDAQRLQQRRVFTLRRPDFADREVKIARGDFATKEKLSARVGYQDERANIFTRFELGGPRPVRGRTIALPRGVRRNKRDIITAGQRPRALLNKPGVFRITTKRGTGLIVQRMGRRQIGPHQAGHDPNLRVLYGLSLKATLPASLHFLDTAKRVASGDTFEKTFGRELARAIATSK